MPNAAVTVTRVNTNTSQHVLTGPGGSFTVSGLPAGTYRVEIESAGFKRISQQNVELTTTGPVNLTFTMEAGAQEETVQIKGTTPMVQSDNASVSLGLGTRTARELPVIDRNHQELVTLMTGVTPPEASRRDTTDPENNRRFATNGQTPLTNTWYLDGVVNREPFRGAAARVQPLESVQQTNLMTSSQPRERLPELSHTLSAFSFQLVRPRRLLTTKAAGR